MADGQFIQIAPVTLRLHQGTARETVITALYALDNLGSVWKLIDQGGGQRWEVVRGRD
jgi:hypothetical protein